MGDKVTKFKVGDIGGVGCMVDSCRTCEACDADLEQYCSKPATFTYASPDDSKAGHTLGGYSDIQVVASLDELVSTSFQNGINALCWLRALPGDFRAVADALSTGEGIVTLDESFLKELSLSEAGQIVREVLLADERCLRALDPQPNSRARPREHLRRRGRARPSPTTVSVCL